MSSGDCQLAIRLEFTNGSKPREEETVTFDAAELVASALEVQTSEIQPAFSILDDRDKFELLQYLCLFNDYVNNLLSEIYIHVYQRHLNSKDIIVTQQELELAEIDYRVIGCELIVDNDVVGTGRF